MTADIIVIAAGCAVRIFTNPETGNPGEVRVGWASDSADVLEHVSEEEFAGARFVYCNGVTAKDAYGAEQRIAAAASAIWPGTTAAPLVACPRCAKALRVRNGARGRFVGCSGYPDCRFTSDDLSLVEGGGG